MSSCAAIEEALLAFKNDLLEGRERGKIADHLERCAPCRARAEVLQAELSILGEEAPAPEGLWGKISEELERAPAGFLDGIAGEPAGYLDGQAARASASVEEAERLLDRITRLTPPRRRPSEPRVRARPPAPPRRSLALAGVLVLILATSLGLSLFQLPESAPSAAESAAQFRRGIFLAERAAIEDIVFAPSEGGPR